MPSRKVNEKRKATAVAKLTGLAEAAIGAENVAAEKRHRMYAGMLKAFDAGMTYEEIAGIVELSKIRVSQVLRDERERRDSK